MEDEGMNSSAGVHGGPMDSHKLQTEIPSKEIG